MNRLKRVNADLTAQSVFQSVGNVFSNVSAAILFLVFGTACWIFNAPALCVGAISSFIVITLLTAKDVKNIFALILFAPFFIHSTPSSDGVWSVFTVFIVAAAVAVPCFALSKFIVERPAKKGGFYIPIAFFIAAIAIGGAFGRFNIVAFSVGLGVGIELLSLYFIALCYTEDLADFFAQVFIVGAVLVFVEIFIYYYSDGVILSGGKLLSDAFFSAESLNTAALIFTLAMGGCLHFGLYRKKQIFFAVLSLLFLVTVFITRCRTMAAVALILAVAEFVLFAVYTERKKEFLAFTVCLTVVLAVISAVLFDAVKDTLSAFIEKRGTIDDTRSTLFKWCIDRFAEYPVFGYGFYLDEPLLLLRLDVIYVVLAHNTLIQWITSTGIVGTCLATVFYCGKYKILFSGFNFKRISVLTFSLIIAANGILDQAALMDIFVLITSFALIACAENIYGKTRLYR